MLANYFKDCLDKATKYSYKIQKIIELLLLLYRLKQSVHVQQQQARKELAKLSFQPLDFNLAAYVNKIIGLILSSYVDDFFIVTPLIKEGKEFIKAISKALTIKDLKESEQFLKVRILKGCARKELPTEYTLVQDCYIDQTFTEIRLDSLKLVKTPIETKAKDIAIPCKDQEDNTTKIYDYCLVVG